MNAKQISEAFGGFTYHPNRMDVQHGFIWDSAEFIPSKLEGFVFNFFETPQLSVGPNYTKLHVTSMLRPFALLAPEAFAVQRLMFTFSDEANDKEISHFVENTTFQFFIGQKWYLQSPICLLNNTDRKIESIRVCGSCKILLMGATSCPHCGEVVDVPFPMPPNANPGRQFYMDLKINLVIDHQASFFCRIICEPLQISSPLRLWCHLEGLHTRGVS